MQKRSALAAIPLLLIGCAAFAQSAAVASPPALDLYATLTPGDQEIADALYRAELSSPQSGLKPMSLDDIVAARLSCDGWGAVFRQMKQGGLVTAKTLGQVVCGRTIIRHGTMRAEGL